MWQFSIHNANGTLRHRPCIRGYSYSWFNCHVLGSMGWIQSKPRNFSAQQKGAVSPTSRLRCRAIERGEVESESGIRGRNARISVVLSPLGNLSRWMEIFLFCVITLWNMTKTVFCGSGEDRCRASQCSLGNELINLNVYCDLWFNNDLHTILVVMNCSNFLSDFELALEFLQMR